jgi:CheY-like chemotaxis protein
VLSPEAVGDPTMGTLVQGSEAPPTSETPFVYLEVADNGGGMSPDTLSRIFDPFFSTKFSGRGLGLAAVMGIVQGHQGLIRIRTAPGEGTTFRVLFPAVAGGVREPEKLSATRSEWRGSGTVLVVEDEEGVREVADRILQDFGFDTLLAVDGRDALEQFERARSTVTAVLLDLSMPRMGGQEVFRRLRQMCPALPVIIMSGYTEESVAAQFSASGADLTAFLQKPFLAEDLVDVLRRVVQSSPAAAEPAGRATLVAPRIS